MGRGQAYDGASCMSSENVGLGARMTEVNPKSPYMHCMSHRLNLSIGDACSLLIISTIIDKMKKLNNFFNKSPKKEILLSKIAEKATHQNIRKVLIGLCNTRWSERYVA